MFIVFNLLFIVIIDSRFKFLVVFINTGTLLKSEGGSVTLLGCVNGVARQRPERGADRQRDTGVSSPQRHTSRAKRATNVTASSRNRKAKQRTHPPRPVEDNKETMVIGTSLARGQGPLLNKAGVNACCYTNSGCLIPQIAPRLPDLVKEVKPAQIVIHCGGNDSVSQIWTNYRFSTSTFIKQ